MVRAMRTAASGMTAQKLNVDTISNNLANVNTTGYKKSKLEFQDLLYQTYRMAGATSQVGSEVPVELQIGYGTRAVASQRIFSQGNLSQTYNALDVAIDGNGFIPIELPDGTEAYTRDGALKLSREGEIVTSDGYRLTAAITIPAEAEEISVGVDGTVTVRNAGETEVTDIGQITLVKFLNPAGLSAIGRNMFVQTTASGDPIEGIPGENGLGQIRQGFLELSNVETVEEMVNLIIAQRAYEINSKAIQTAEDMTQIANNLKR
ncbi:flagellar basal-body rod protein FlgG [bacterium]|nr:flagellar basal-body rod protein FlgG [bacterium]